MKQKQKQWKTDYSAVNNKSGLKDNLSWLKRGGGSITNVNLEPNCFVEQMAKASEKAISQEGIKWQQ